MFYLTTHSTHFIYGYMDGVEHMVKYHSDSERGNLTHFIYGYMASAERKEGEICFI